MRLHAPRSTRALLSAGCLSLSAIAGLAAAADGESASGEAKAPASGGATHGALAMDEQRQALATLVGPVKAVSVPEGVNAQFWQSLAPKDNPGNEAQVALGRKLYFDTRLSKDGSVACATL